MKIVLLFVLLTGVLSMHFYIRSGITIHGRRTYFKQRKAIAAKKAKSHHNKIESILAAYFDRRQWEQLLVLFKVIDYNLNYFINYCQHSIYYIYRLLLSSTANYNF